ncbi:3-oxo-isoapionate decarboxylase [subsurface metagenome]
MSKGDSFIKKYQNLDKQKNITVPRVGLGSYAFRYAIGFKDFKIPKPMTIVDFLYEAKRLGFQGVQLCENLALSELDKKELLVIKEKAKDLDLFIEVGMNDLSERSLLKYMDMAKILSSNLLRVVLSRKTYNDLGNDIQHLYEKSLDLLKNVVIECKRNNIYIGIENHFDLPPKQ